MDGRIWNFFLFERASDAVAQSGFRSLKKNFFLDFLKNFRIVCFFNLDKNFIKQILRVKLLVMPFRTEKIIQIRSSILELQHCENG